MPAAGALAEEGWTDNAVAELTVAHYLESLKQSGIDTLLLGCTHYPLLREMFARILGPREDRRFRDCDCHRCPRSAADAQARATSHDGGQSFFVTETPIAFVRVGRRFLGPQVESAVRIER